MKRLLMAIVGMLLVITLAGCNIEMLEIDKELNEEVETGDAMVYLPKNELKELEIELYDKIRQDYVNEFLIKEYPNATLNDVKIQCYLGEFNQYTIAFYTNKFTGVGFYTWIVKDIVGGVEFMYPDSNVMLAWKDGKFYTLGELYKENELTLEHLNNISSAILKHED